MSWYLSLSSPGDDWGERNNPSKVRVPRTSIFGQFFWWLIHRKGVDRLAQGVRNLVVPWTHQEEAKCWLFSRRLSFPHGSHAPRLSLMVGVWRVASRRLGVLGLLLPISPVHAGLGGNWTSDRLKSCLNVKGEERGRKKTPLALFKKKKLGFTVKP